MIRRMSLGPTVRRRLGRLEQPAADAYRRLFFNVDDFAERVRAIVGNRHRVLEIGCGDGEVATALVAAFPDAEYLGIDIAEEPGRRYRGRQSRVEFLTMRSAALRRAGVEPFDMIVIADVLHHIPDDAARVAVLEDAAAMLAPGGVLIVKEWERQPTLAYWAGWAADYFVSGDRDVRYMTRDELCALVTRAPGLLRAVVTVTGRPWACNVIHVMRPTTTA